MTLENPIYNWGRENYDNIRSYRECVHRSKRIMDAGIMNNLLIELKAFESKVEEAFNLMVSVDIIGFNKLVALYLGLEHIPVERKIMMVAKKYASDIILYNEGTKEYLYPDELSSYCNDGIFPFPEVKRILKEDEYYMSAPPEVDTEGEEILVDKNGMPKPQFNEYDEYSCYGDYNYYPVVSENDIIKAYHLVTKYIPVNPESIYCLPDYLEYELTQGNADLIEADKVCLVKMFGCIVDIENMSYFQLCEDISL